MLARASQTVFKALKAQFYRKILLKPELRFFGVIEKLDLEFCPEVRVLTTVIIDFGYQNLESWKLLILLGKMG